MLLIKVNLLHINYHCVVLWSVQLILARNKVFSIYNQLFQSLYLEVLPVLSWYRVWGWLNKN